MSNSLCAGFCAVGSALVLLLAQAAQAADEANGKALHDENCTSCHIQMTGGDGSALYTRKDRKMKSMDSLKTQILRCASAKNLSWFDEEVNDVAAYLNATYYEFDTAPKAE